MIKPDKALFYFDNEEDEGGDDSTLSVNEEEIDEGLLLHIKFRSHTSI